MEQNNSSEQMKLCANCGAKCKSVYKYCNECGAMLSADAPKATATSTGFVPQNSGSSFTPAPPISTPASIVSTPTQPVSTPTEADEKPVEAEIPASDIQGEEKTNAIPTVQNISQPKTEPDMNTFFDGVSAEDMFLYTGRKPKLYGYLQRQQMYPANKLFCVPLFLLGLFFGFFGMACWYLYHKLYKPAAIFFGLTAFFFIVNIIGSYGIMEAFGEFMKQVILSADYGVYSDFPTDQQAVYMMKTFFDDMPTGYLIVSYLGNIAQLALAIVMPFFAYNTYRKTAIERIRKAYMSPFAPNIEMVGGTNKGMLALAIVVAVLIYIMSFVIILTPFIETVMELMIENPSFFEYEYSDIPHYDFHSDFNY